MHLKWISVKYLLLASGLCLCFSAHLSAQDFERFTDRVANTSFAMQDEKKTNQSEALTHSCLDSREFKLAYATYRPENDKIGVDLMLTNNIAKKESTDEAFCLSEILKLKELEKQNLRLVYENSFNSPSALKDWVMEGPGIAKIKKGKLLIHSKYSKATQKYLIKNNIQEDNGTGYYDFVALKMRKDFRDGITEYHHNGDFAGGHIVFWNKHKTPANYVLEFDFQSLSDYPLHMIMFDHLGINGEGVFDAKLKPRNGLAHQYTNSDLQGSRISFFAPDRKTTNLRKSPEKQILTMGPDYTLGDKNTVHRLRMTKKNKVITWQIDEKVAFIYTEKNPKNVLSGGYFAIRLMVPAMGFYDNIKIYEILN